VDVKIRTEIVSRYGKILENRVHNVGRARDLPFDKALIRCALFESLLETNDSQTQEVLKVGLIELDAFLSDEEFELASKYEDAVMETSRRMETEELHAVLGCVEMPDSDAYSEILSRILAEQEQTLLCVRRLLPSKKNTGPRTVMADPDILKAGAVDFVGIVVNRQDVQTSDVNPTLKILNRFLQDRETVVRFRGQLDLSFEGYDEDERELHEIDAVRRFVADLDRKFPFWFYFLNLRSDALAAIFLCLCRYSRESDRMLVPDKAEWERLLAEHFVAVNWLFVNYGLDDRANEALTMQVSDYFESRTKPPNIQ
jgi:hypothetical protein